MMINRENFVNKATLRARIDHLWAEKRKILANPLYRGRPVEMGFADYKALYLVLFNQLQLIQRELEELPYSSAAIALLGRETLIRLYVGAE